MQVAASPLRSQNSGGLLVRQAMLSSLEHHRAYLNMGQMARPLIGCNVGLYMHQCFPRVTNALPRGLITPDDIPVDLFLEDCEQLYQDYREIDDDYPFVGAALFFVPWMEAIVGCPVWASEASMWTEPMVNDWSLWSWEHPGLDTNTWVQKLLQLTEALVVHAQGRYSIAPTHMRGPADMLAAMRGATRFVLDFYDNPNILRRAIAHCARVWTEVGKAQFELLPPSSAGYVAGAGGLRAWAPDRIIWLQEDALSFMSPTLYREFFLPWDRWICQAFPYTAFHLHGSTLWAVPELVTLPELHVLEVNYESVGCDVEATFAAWKAVQMRKPLVVWKQFDGDSFWPWLDRIQRDLSPRGLSIQVTVANAAEGMAIMSKLMAARWEPTADAI